MHQFSLQLSWKQLKKPFLCIIFTCSIKCMLIKCTYSKKMRELRSLLRYIVDCFAHIYTSNVLLVHTRHIDSWIRDALKYVLSDDCSKK